jgi:organic anion transporter 5A
MPLEVRFESLLAAIIMSGNEVSQILTSIPLSYFGGKGHRPRWMGFGVLLTAISCFILASPHFFYGPGEEALSLTKEFYEKYHIHANVLSATEQYNFTVNGTLSSFSMASAGEVILLNRSF